MHPCEVLWSRSSCGCHRLSRRTRCCARVAGINHADSGTDDRCAGTFRFWLSVHPRGYGGAVAGISVRASADASRENTTKPDCGWWNSLPSRDRRAGRDTSGRRGGDGDLYRQAQRHTIPSNSLVNAKNRMSDTSSNRLLWSVKDQQERLLELTATTADPRKEAPLRRDVRSLGILLGRVLVEQAGGSLYESVERLRNLLIEHRERQHKATETPPALLDEAQEFVRLLDVPTAYRISKAFGTYFELTNLAETNHRKRRRRAAQLHRDQPPLPGSFRGTLLYLREEGFSAQQVLSALAEIEVVPVFTAHPTEITRRTTLLKRRRIADQLLQIDELPLSDADASEHEEILLSEITALWQTDEVRLNKPSVSDEIRSGIRYFNLSLFEAIPKIYEEMSESFRAVYGTDVGILDLPAILRFGSWIGGDRDGNPLVTAEKTSEALALSRDAVLHHYIEQSRNLARRLSVSEHQVSASSKIRAAIERYERLISVRPSEYERTPAAEVYRRLLLLMAIRLRYANEPAISNRIAYASAEEFELDLLTVRSSLSEHGGLRTVSY